MNLFNKALDFIFPPICGVCGKMGENYLCYECKEKLELISKTTYDKTNNHIWLFEYDDIRNLLLKYKFNECSYLYKTISEFILSNIKVRAILNQADYIIPVPIHIKRKFERGYNQCELIAKRLSKEIDNLEYLPDVLAKKKNVNPQSTLNQEERRINIQGAFYIKKYINLENKSVVLFDDIYTTGSTVNECIKVLKKLNYKTIYIFTIAKK